MMREHRYRVGSHSVEGRGAEQREQRGEGRGVNELPLM